MQFAPKRPDAAVAHSELRRNLGRFVACVLAVRAAPYVLQLLWGAED